MHISNIGEAKAQLSHLIKLALAGDEVLIARANEPLVKLIPVDQDTSPRVGGFWAGRIQIAEDLAASDREVLELFESSNIFPVEGQ